MSTPLTISELFTPAPSGVGGNPNVPPPAGSWMSVELQIATQVMLPTTAWQPGQPERTIMAIQSVMYAQQDAIVSTIAQGGFLRFAASGFVTYTALDGVTVITQPVTPDPSIPSQNPTGAPGWLDALGQSMYNVTRLPATYATGTLYIVNTNVSTAGPFGAGGYHVANTRTFATYANTQALSIPSSIIPGTGGTVIAVAVGSPTTITTQSAHGLSVGDVVFLDQAQGLSNFNSQFATVSRIVNITQFTVTLATSGLWTSGGIVYKCLSAPFQADVIGIASNAAPSEVTTTVTQVNGVQCTNLNAWSAANYESNDLYAKRCLDKLGALSPNGPSQAYEYFALSAQQLLAAQNPPVSLTNGPIATAQTFVTPATGVVTTLVASQSPATNILGQPITPGCSQLPVTGAVGTPIVISTGATPHTLRNGDFALISGVLGNTNANGIWNVTVLSATTFSLNGSATNATYTGGGTIDGGDLGQVDNLLQQNVVPDGIAGAITKSALALPVVVAATVIVPQAFVAVYRAAVNDALTRYYASLPIGGFLPPGTAVGIVPISAVEGALVDVGVQVVGGVSYVRQVTNLVLNSSPNDLPYPSNEYLAVFGSTAINVQGV